MSATHATLDESRDVFDIVAWPNKYADVCFTFDCCNERIDAHRLLLSSRSTFFEKAFSTQSARPFTYHIKQFSCRQFRRFLALMYDLDAFVLTDRMLTEDPLLLLLDYVVDTITLSGEYQCCDFVFLGLCNMLYNCAFVTMERIQLLKASPRLFNRFVSCASLMHRICIQIGIERKFYATPLAEFARRLHKVAESSSSLQEFLLEEHNLQLLFLIQQDADEE